MQWNSYLFSLTKLTTHVLVCGKYHKILTTNKLYFTSSLCTQISNSSKNILSERKLWIIRIWMIIHYSSPFKYYIYITIVLRYVMYIIFVPLKYLFIVKFAGLLAAYWDKCIFLKFWNFTNIRKRNDYYDYIDVWS